VAYSQEDLRRMITRSLQHPDELSDIRRAFIAQTFRSMLDGQSGRRVTLKLLEIANDKRK